MIVDIKFNRAELEQLDLLLDNEITSISYFLSDVKGDEEKEFWITEQKDLKKLRNKLKQEVNLVIQELKIDDMIENQIDDAIAKRHGVEI